MARFIPDKTLDGGTLVGTSYTNEFACCPYSWFNSYLRPHPDRADLEAGIQPRFTSPFLLAGRTVHIGFAAWYGSGIKDGADTGERDIDRAVEAAHVAHQSTLFQYEDSDRASSDWEMAEIMLRDYHDRYGPQGSAPEWPELEVAVDGKGEALIEREFSLPLGYRDYVLTTRPDLICTVRGMLCTLDHKTSVARFVGERKQWTHWDPQFKGEYLCLTELFPNEPIHRATANIVVKNRTPNSKFDVAERESVTCTATDLWAYKLELLNILQHIDRSVSVYKELRAVGLDPETAACHVFPRHGTRTQACTSYGGCKYQALCADKEHVDQAMRHFKPRAIEERDADKARPY